MDGRRRGTRQSMRRRHPGRLLGAFALGAAAAYLLDPARGRSRRARLADQAQGRLRRARRRAASRRRDLTNRARGLEHELRARPHAPEDDRELVQKVRSELLGRARFRHLDLVVDADNGVVHLRGTAPADVASALVGEVLGLEGVRGVEDLLHRPGEPAPNKAAALTASETQASRPDSLQRESTPSPPSSPS